MRIMIAELVQTIVTKARSESEKREARLNKSLGSEKRKSIKIHLENG